MRANGNACDWAEALLASRLDGTLGAFDGDHLDAHLIDCSECRGLATTLAPESQRDPVGRVFPAVDPSAYELGPVLACGGMGSIRIARDLRIGREVAIKELLVDSDELAARFVREARIAGQLQHPNIVPIYEVGTWADGKPFYSMRLVKGQTLFRALSGAASLDARMELLPSVIAAADAVAFAHASGIVHRDLTPANILIGDFGETVVIDWGLAKDLRIDPYRQVSERFRTGVTEGVLTFPGDVIGTPAYMPCEQATGEPTDERVDVYALGAILYHLLAGQAPYVGGSSKAVLAQVREAAPPALIGRVPSALASIVAKAMARDARGRYATARELAIELRRFQAGLLVDAHSYSIRERLARWFRRDRIKLGSAAVILAMIGVAFGM